MKALADRGFSLIIQPEDEALQNRCITAIIQGLDEFEQANKQNDNNRPLMETYSFQAADFYKATEKFKLSTKIHEFSRRLSFFFV